MPMAQGMAFCLLGPLDIRAVYLMGTLQAVAMATWSALRGLPGCPGEPSFT